MTTNRRGISRLAGTGRLPSMKGLRVLVVGLGRFGGGVGAVRWLAEQGAVVTVTDQACRETLAESLEAIRDLEVALHLGGHDPRDLNAADLVIINPAVNKTRSEFFQAVERQGVPWTTETNLFCERCSGTVIGVTGSYGKSTVCAMLAEVLQACRRKGNVEFTGVHLGGNIGHSLLLDLPVIRPTDLVVLELSNAQLEDLHRINWAPPIAVITNLKPHHLDRYESFQAYARAKLNIVCDPNRASKIILGALDPQAEAMLAQRVPSQEGRVVRVYPPQHPIALRVPGKHNQANAACVLTVAHELGLEGGVVREALAAFEGLPHRLQHVRTVDGVDYYNDSKSTSPAATEAAVASLDRPIVAIVGGQEKGVPLTDCARALARVCRAVICIGQSGPGWAAAVRAAARVSGGMIVQEPDGLEAAVALARTEARSGDVVLFSPGAPSFDRYHNFAQRGRHFIDLVNAL